MTAVNWMIKKLIERHSGEVGKEYIKIFEEAKQMEKQQIKDAWNNGAYCGDMINIENSEDYFDETYGSKGSDEHISDTNKMI